MPYPRNSADDKRSVPASPRFPAIEEGVLAFWKKDDTFQASIDQRAGCEEWVFYDGPPFANGLPHYGHLLTGYAKDLFPRFQTMRGKQVQRRFGWDTHGLPAELEAERQLGITDKSEIDEMGIAAFNAVARESVLRYTSQWQDYVTRQARWVDFENDYKTLDISFMESVIWAFKQLYDKGLAYEGYRVLPYCWRDQTPLSNHELRMDDDVYKMRQDQTVTVTFPLIGDKAEALGLAGVRALAWTTTPWTLPTNLALAVGPRIEYSVVPAGPLGREMLDRLSTSSFDRLSTSSFDRLTRRERPLPPRHGHNRRARQGPRLRDTGRRAGSSDDNVPRYGTRRPRLSAALGLLCRHRHMGYGERLANTSRGICRDRGRHRDRAPGAGVRRRRPDLLRGCGHPRCALGGCGRPVFAAHRTRRRPAGVRRQQTAHQAIARRRPAAQGRQLRTQLPALLAVP